MLGIMLPVLACAYFTATVKGESKAMDEYIDRTALGIGYADPKLFDNPAYANGWNSAIKIINEAPAADVAPVVHGKWIRQDESFTRFKGFINENWEE